VTGSGKTEVYLKAVEAVLVQGGQVLVLVPEIGLTPQLVARFEARLTAPIAVMHSALNDSERLAAWQAARTGEAAVVIGTRSAVFTPLPRLQLIIIDEEHDPSFKQQDGVRYHARDVAILRASHEKVPVVLGSATPSLESVYNAEQGRYQWLSLPERTAGAQPPRVQTLDQRRLKQFDGLSPPLIEALRQTLAHGEQSLVFLNRRGFAPVLMCHDCGWLAPCTRCDARLTVHRGSRKLRCHHCGAEAPLPSVCPVCASANLHGIGEGTERIEQALAQALPAARIERIDRDSTRRKGALEEKFARVHTGAVDILVGTQMLAKGHDFPNLTLVAVVNADQGLYSSDFRSEERLVQQLMQVAGRAGRADKPGTVLIQTWHPDNPVFQAIATHDYREFARYALAERNSADYPPASHLALVRAESARPRVALEFLERARRLGQELGLPRGVQLHDVVPAAMERRAGRYRAQLLVQSNARPALHEFLGRWRAALDAMPRAREVRWALDVDPVDLY
jgi:primosomal protein N' (replication factor Y)